MTTSFFISKELEKVLKNHNISRQQFIETAYGKSVGIDLFNSSDKTISIPPCQVDYKVDHVFETTLDENIDSERNIIDKQFKQIYKKLIPTGLHVKLPENYMAIIQERGSITKTPLKVRAGIIDPGYTGEIFINCVNLSKHHWEIVPGAKLPFQLIIVPVTTDFDLMDKDQWKEFHEQSARKDKKIGSSD